jgi:hypothetical protein
MSDQMLTIAAFGAIVVAFGAFASYMGNRQKEREEREHQGRQVTH